MLGVVEEAGIVQELVVVLAVQVAEGLAQMDLLVI